MLAAVLALALSSAPAPRLVLHAELGASLPTRLLAQLARTKAMDSIMGAAASPASAQLFPCTTGAGVGTWQGPSCFTAFLISASGSTTSAPSMMGWTNFTTGNAMQLEFGDLGNAIQAGYGDRMQIFSYHGIKIIGGRASTTAPAFEAGSGNNDPSLTVVGQGSVPTIVSSGGGGLRIDNGSTGAPISFSGRGTVVNPGAQGATSCGVVAVTVNGANPGSECFVGLPSSYTSTVLLFFDCYVSATNTVQFRQCNPTAGTLTPPAGTYVVRVFNP